MANKLKFHLDESVSNAIAKGLRMRGIDVTTSPEKGLMGSSDEEQLAYALSQGRVIFTFDDDFLVLSSMGLEHWGLFIHINVNLLAKFYPTRILRRPSLQVLTILIV